MDIIQWLIQYHLINESAHVVQNHANSFIFTGYVILSIIVKKPSLLMAFFISCLLFDAAIFDSFSEAQLYALTFLIYSSVTMGVKMKLKSKLSCVIITILAALLCYDAAFYGFGGCYGEVETFMYRNIESLSLCAHIIFICSFISYARIKDGFRYFFSATMRCSWNTFYFLPF